MTAIEKQIQVAEKRIEKFETMTTEEIKEYDRLKKEGNEENLKKFLENAAQKHFTGTQTKSQGLKR